MPPTFCPDYYMSDLHVVAECKACQALKAAQERRQEGQA